MGQRTRQYHQLYFYRGTHDTCYRTGAEEATLGFYARLTGDRGTHNRVAYEGSVGSNHAQPTAAWGAPCGGKGDPRYSYIESCGYDGAGAVLQHLYNNSLNRPTAAQPYDPDSLIVFDLSEFWVNASRPDLKTRRLPADGSAGTSDRAYAYVPVRCRRGAAAAAGAPPCRLHLYHHGCGGPWGSVFYEGVAHHAGFNEWAERNGIVVLYPVMTSWGDTGQTKAGCWDGYGQTGSDYALKSGAQIAVVANLIKHAVGSYE